MGVTNHRAWFVCFCDLSICNFLVALVHSLKLVDDDKDDDKTNYMYMYMYMIIYCRNWLLSAAHC